MATDVSSSLSFIQLRCATLERQSPSLDWGFVLRGRHELFPPGNDRPPTHIATVHGVEPQGAAHRAGLRSDDAIVAVDGQSVKEMEHGDIVELFRDRTSIRVELIGISDRKREMAQIVPRCESVLRFLWALGHNLRTLCLWRLQIDSLNVDLRSMRCLDELYVNHCKMTSLIYIRGLELLSSLRYLSLDHNSLTVDVLGKDCALASLSSLTSLSLGNNTLTSVPACIFQLTRLVSLSLSRNAIVDIPASISELKQLERLFVDNNKLTNLKPEIMQLPHLEVLSVANNKIDREPSELGTTQLKILRTEGNPYVLHANQRGKCLQRRVTTNVKEQGKPAIIDEMRTRVL